MASKLEQDEHEITQKCVEVLKMGCPRSTAAARAGISITTLRNYLCKGAKGRQPYKRFARAVEVAEAEVEGAALGGILARGQKDWKANEAYLRLRFPEKYANRETACEKDLDRLLDIMAERLNGKQFVAILNEWDGRRTYED